MASRTHGPIRCRWIVERALFVLFAAAGITTFHCTIDRIPHIYCDVNDDCDQPPFTFCDVKHHTCIDADGGVSDGDMDMGAGPDMFCSSSAGCSDVAPICSMEQRCRACMGSPDIGSSDDAECAIHNPATPRCNGQTGMCVACLVSADCKNPMLPVCNTVAFTCRKCAAHSECPSGVCKDNGTCADATDVAYVNNAAGSNCVDDSHVSSPMWPYCQIQFATTRAKPYVHVSASTTAYNALSFLPTAGDLPPLTIVGPAGRGTAPKAMVSQSGAQAVYVSTTSPKVTLTIDGLDLEGATMGTAQPGVLCQSPAQPDATITIRNSTIQMSGTAGVDSSGCTLTLDANIISFNVNEGVKLANTKYVLTNNIIHHNGTNFMFPGITIDEISMGTIAFDTVVSNGGAGPFAGGIHCPTAGMNTPKIQYSIVAMNAKDSTGTQFLGNCMLQSPFVVTGPDSFSGAMQMPPMFVSGFDFHLDTSPGAKLDANRTCCIDRISSPITPNADHDADRGQRPLGLLFDVGAYEAQ